MGHQFSATFSGETLPAEITGFVFQDTRPIYDTTPADPNATAQRFDAGLPAGRGKFSYLVNEAYTPVLPAGTEGTLTVQFEDAGHKYAGTALLYNMRLIGQSTGGGPPQRVEYDYVYTTAVAVTDT